MKIYYLLFIVLISFQSCSSSDTPMMEAEMQMEEDEMMNTSTFEGDFMSSAHPTSGKATINEAKTILSFTNFKTDDGPLLEVYLATDTSASTYITLGALQGVNGNYEYALPTNIDYAVYNHVIVWCVTFSVNFGYSVLK
ncbi:DM13 domain-containing protein [Mariniflexile litorale]|uniref:DM13 domain-containing protein n=1 Tax=Mariniflexile litorale TaxID=3045158 RepID=A0AAU7EGN8_9FLAO|nr:DM13 domain-containing protein [Mariniflexile sp. KMM 9835]MDQ8211796.1 DM13 domain-containing protein [Mariniflexile sp. KMM 9835]